MTRQRTYPGRAGEVNEMRDLRYVGRGVSRIDGLEKVSGAATFVDDLDFGPTLLHAQVVESPHAHALIKRIDASKAEAVPGVIGGFTGADFPFTFGLYMQDRHVFAVDRVRFVGEQVAAVVADNARTAKRAARLVEVDYEVLEPIFDPLEAATEGAQLLHPGLMSYGRVPWFFPKEDTNISHWRKTRRGDVEAGFAEADAVFEDTYRVPRYAHCAIEPHVVIGKYDQAGRLTVWTASQSPYTQRHVFAGSRFAHIRDRPLHLLRRPARSPGRRS